MKKYKLIYLTKKNDTLLEEIREYYDIRDARKAAAIKLDNSNLNDVHRIMVRRVYEKHN